MEQKVIRTLNVYYYAILVLTLLSGAISYFLIMKDYVKPIDPMTTLGQVLQYIVIFDALLTIPSGLYLCKRRCKQLSLLEDENAKLQGYQSIATLRIILVGNTMIFGIAAFYLMGAYQSMLWITAVSAIGWYFTKPTVAKLQAELQPEDPNQEKY